MFQGSEKILFLLLLTVQPHVLGPVITGYFITKFSSERNLGEIFQYWMFHSNWLNVFGDEPWPTVIGETAANMADTTSTKPWGKWRTLKLLKATVFSPAWTVSECCLVLGLLFYEKQLPAWSLNSQRKQRGNQTSKAAGWKMKLKHATTLHRAGRTAESDNDFSFIFLNMSNTCMSHVSVTWSKGKIKIFTDLSHSVELPARAVFLKPRLELAVVDLHV